MTGSLFLTALHILPLNFFMEPIAVALNYVTKEHNYKQIVMTGISGGGWSTILYAAIDPRISLSYPVAGSVPFFLRDVDWGDWEQNVTDLYRIADYPELYILALMERAKAGSDSQ